MWCIDIIADQLQCKVSFDAGAHIEFTISIKRPAAMCSLVSPKIDGDFLVKSLVDLIKKMAKKHEFRGDR